MAKRFSLSALVSAIFLLFAGPAVALELLVVERANCSWCLLWDSEIAPIYAKSKEGRVAPFVRVDIRELPNITFSAPIEYTPTFVLIEDNREIERFTGYSSREIFWETLDDILREYTVHIRQN